MTDLCLYEVADGVATITFNRPERNNGMNGALELAYYRALERARDDRDARVIVVTGAGRSFCPGADLAGERRPDDEPLPNGRIPTTFPATITKPMIAAVNGGCAGVGLVQALHCDVRFASSGAKFTTAFARRGLVAEYGIAWLLERLVGRGRASDLLLSGRTFDAAEALQLGVVNRVYEPTDLLAETLAYARDIAVNVAPSSAATMKEQLRRIDGQTYAEAVADAHRYMYESLRGPDSREGIGAFVERRDPAFLPLGEGSTFSWMDPAARPPA